MKSIISKGKNISEAIELGLKVMNVSKDDVNIEILGNEKKGFLGIGAKYATVKLSKLNSIDESNQTKTLENLRSVMEKTEREIQTFPEILEKPNIIASSSLSQEETVEPTKENVKALVWVETGKLYIQNSLTNYPIVSISDGVEVLVNGSLMSDKNVVLSQQDVVEVYGRQELKETKWSIAIDSNKLKVLLEVEPGYKITRTICDTKPSRHITLQAKDHKESINTLSFEQVLKAMGAMHVKYGFNHVEIMKAVETIEKGAFEVANGTPAIAGQDGWLEITFNRHESNLNENELEKIDFRELNTIHSIEAGAAIGIIHPPVPGRPGVTVTNEPLPAKQTNPISLIMGQGIKLIGDTVVAVESGRPIIEQRGSLIKVSILQKLVHRNDVSLASGNIHFDGDVTILGNIQENMVVEAGGDIIVLQSIYGAKVFANISIIAKQNIVGSELSAGKNNLIIAEMGYLLTSISEQLDKMIIVINQLTESSAFKSSDFPRTGLKPLIYILLEKKFKTLNPMVKNFMNLFEKENNLYDKEWSLVSTSLTKVFLTISKEFITLEEIVELSLNMKRLSEICVLPAEPKSFINILSATNSQLYCSGNISVTGTGCINTKIHSEGKLKIAEVLRGGEVFAKGGVHINETGSENGTSTLITVPSDQKIRIEKALEGTILRIGNARREIKETTYTINAWLSNDGKIVL